MSMNAITAGNHSNIEDNGPGIWEYVRNNLLSKRRNWYTPEVLLVHTCVTNVISHLNTDLVYINM